MPFRPTSGKTIVFGKTILPGYVKLIHKIQDEKNIRGSGLRNKFTKSISTFNFKCGLVQKTKQKHHMKRLFSKFSKLKK